ncbi:MAG TPA: TonB-dependent receptor [Caulobacteraceae bacterium]|nr:TonB-dependent receptor [Caulobacteraceae bacterium]
MSLKAIASSAVPGAMASIIGAATAALAQSATPPSKLEIVTVIANAPLATGAISIDKLAGQVETLSITALADKRQTSVIANLVGAQLADVSLNDEQGSPFQPDLTYRGFEASPISGVAEGLAVYQDGVRLNEAFGDNVNWDLVPQFAARTFTIQSDNPAFGLNALGGAVTLNMKDGLSYQGVGGEISGGSFGDVAGHVEYGSRFGDFGLYVGIGGLHDDGFRYRSPTTLRQGYADLAYQHGALSLHLTASGAVNDIDAVGPTPVQRLAADPRATFTYPQTMQDGMALVQLRGTYAVRGDLSVGASFYYRRFDQRLVDGNTTDVAACGNDPAQLCLEGAYDYPGDALYDANGHAVPASVLPAGATPGETDFTHTATDSLGAALQASLTAPLGAHGNDLVVGGSIDHGSTAYGAHGELGTLQPDLRVAGVGVTIDQALSPTAQPPIEAPVSVTATNTYLGAYAVDVFDLTRRLSLSLSGRFNSARIGLRDRLGGGLSGQHSFARFNPGVGATYKVADGLTAYAGYSESNRAPTAGELSCADRASPCLLDAFLVSDPKLKQVVAHTVEVGLRGRAALPDLGGQLTWSISAYRTDSVDDILLLATQINGFGYFQNAGATRRQGVDASLAWRAGRWGLSASYAYLEASFLDAEILSSNSPAANASGFIHVRPGERLPMDPANRLTLSADVDLTSAWSAGVDVQAQSGQFLVGDESNQEPQLPGFATVALRTVYRIGPRLQLFADVENLFDRRDYTYGAFTDLGGLPPNVRLTNPRTYSPAEGRAFTAGLRLRFD